MSLLREDQIQGLLQRVTYKPGWSLAVYETPTQGIWIRIHARVEDSYHPGESTDLMIRSPLPPFRSEEGLLSWLRWRLERIEVHEALAVDTPIPTPNGWALMGDLIEGDHVFGVDGRPRRIVKAHPIVVGEDCYRMTMEDSTSIVSSGDHLWWARLASSARKPKIMTTEQMVAEGRVFMVPRAEPRVTPDVELPVDPYLLGYWLGDGTAGQPNICVGGQDVTELELQFKKRGIETRRLHRIGSAACMLTLTERRGFGRDMGSDLSKALRGLACYREKHIPREYLHAGLGQRLELLRGLMDSDGSITPKNYCRFSGRKRLTADVLELTRSLGQLARRSFQVDSRSKEGGTYQVSFTPRGIQPFSLPRKASMVRSTGRNWVAISRIEKVTSVPVRCITIDAEDGLFQVGVGGHVTHNCHEWLKLDGKPLFDPHDPKAVEEASNQSDMRQAVRDVLREERDAL